MKSSFSRNFTTAAAILLLALTILGASFQFQVKEFLEEEHLQLLEEAKKQDSRVMNTLTKETLRTTEKYRDFKAAGTEGITECGIRSIILPLLADHVLREANHYLRILEMA